jgi:hypothetical protein
LIIEAVAGVPGGRLSLRVAQRRLAIPFAPAHRIKLCARESHAMLWLTEHCYTVSRDVTVLYLE